MAGVSVGAFEQSILASCANSRLVKSVAQIQAGVYWVALRAFLAEDIFIDTFYNEQTGKTSFALIRAGKRIFGADNAKIKWHWHPFDDPFRHDAVNHEILFSDFLREVETHLSEQ